MLYVVATDSVDASERMAEYLTGQVTVEDEVHVVNSQFGGDETTSDDIREGEKALEAFLDAMGGAATVERHQFVRGNDPAEDIVSYASEVDADELVFTVRERSPTGKAIFGSVAQRILLNSDRPMRVIPRDA
jgi:nucleotide-binding universal stress UspA family protein